MAVSGCVFVNKTRKWLTLRLQLFNLCACSVMQADLHVQFTHHTRLTKRSQWCEEWNQSQRPFSMVMTKRARLRSVYFKHGFLLLVFTVIISEKFGVFGGVRSPLHCAIVSLGPYYLTQKHQGLLTRFNTFIYLGKLVACRYVRWAYLFMEWATARHEAVTMSCQLLILERTSTWSVGPTLKSYR